MKNFILFVGALAAIVFVGATFAERVVGGQSVAKTNPFTQVVRNVEHSVIASSSAERTSETRGVNNFDEIVVNGSGRVRVRFGADHTVTVSGRGQTVSNATTEVSDDVLTLGSTFSLGSGEVDFDVVVPKLSGIKVQGSADVVIEDEVMGQEFFVSLGGSGNVRAEISTSKLRVNIGGSGDAYLSGETQEADLRVLGSGSVRGTNLGGTDASASILGSGSVELGEFSSIEASITGSGDLLYRGHPKVKGKTLGSGRIKSR